MLSFPEVGLESVAGHLLVLLRVSAWIAIAPPFSHRAIPGQVKVLLSLGITLAVGAGLDFSGVSLATGALAVAALEQVLLGAALGFVCYLVFAAVQAAGNLIDLFGGFQLATAFDPQMQSGAAVFGRLYQMTTVVLLFASDGYLVIFHGLTSTFDVLGVSEGASLEVLSRVVTEGTSQMFLAGLQIAGPLIAILFLTDVGLGLLTRAAPALQAFSLGFPLKIGVTLAVSTMAVAALPSVVDALADDAGRQTLSTATASAAAETAPATLLGVDAP